MSILVKELSRFDLPALERHFLALADEDRRLRFGAGLGDAATSAYVNGIRFDRDAVFGVVDDELRIIGVAHLARGDDDAEFGVSVLPGSRHLGIGGALLMRAHLHARNWGVHELYMHCLTENATIMHLARKNGLDVVAASGEADGRVKLPPPDTSSHMAAALEQRVALIDDALKSQFAGARRAVDSFSAGLALLAPKE